MNIKISVATIWAGKVGVRDRYVEQARNEKKGLEITHKQQTMIIKPEFVDKLIVMKSKTAFTDKFSNRKHYLYYYNWNPKDERQLSLEDLARF